MRSGATISRALWSWARLACAAGILAVLIARLGAGPFVDAFHRTSMGSLGAAVGITALTTVCCAWRWSLVASALDVDVRVRTAIAAYYRSQFLNVALPSGLLGDVHRAVRHGRSVGEMGRSLRSVAWERALGQTVQVGLSVVALLVLPSAFRSTIVVVAAVVVVPIVLLGLVTALATRVASRGAPGLTARIAGAVADDIHQILRERRRRQGIVLASGLAAAGHTAIFLVAVRTSGTTASVGRLLPLALIVLVASAVPMNIAGWGPREGAAAWAFSTAGLSAAQGVTAAVVYGLMALAATLPGAVLLLAAHRQQHDAPTMGTSPAPTRRLAGAFRG